MSSGITGVSGPGNQLYPPPGMPIETQVFSSSQPRTASPELGAAVLASETEQRSPLGYTMNAATAPAEARAATTQESGMTYPSAPQEAAAPPNADGPNDQPPPPDSPESGEQEQPQRPNRGPMVVLDNVEPNVPPQPGVPAEASRSKPQQNEVDQAATLDDGPISAVITHTGGDNNRVDFRGHPALMPFGAGYHQPNETMPTEPGERVQVDTPAEQQASQDELFTHWVNIYEERRPSTGKEDEPDVDTSELPGMSVHGLTESAEGEEPWQMVITGTPVDDNDRRAMADRVTDIIDDAEITPGDQSVIGEMEPFQKELSRGRHAGVLRRMIRVGATSREAAARIARRIAGSVLPADPTTRFTVEHSSEGVVVHEGEMNAEAAALVNESQQITQDNFSSIVSTRRFRDLFRWPNDREVVGLPIVENREFAVNQVFEDDDVKIPMGNITRKGRDVAPMYITDEDLKRHIGVFGASGSGKTELMHKLIAEALKRNPDLQIIVVDFEKEDNYTARLARVLHEAGIPDVDAVINRINPSSSDVLANINLLEITEDSTPEQTADFATEALVASVLEPEPRRILGKYLKAAITLSYEKMGWDIATNTSKYPNGRPPTPTMKTISECIAEVIASAGFKSETQGDLEGWTRTQVESTMRGYAGKLFQNGLGYNIDMDKLRAKNGVTVLELKSLDETSRQVALSALLRQLTNRLQSERSADPDSFLDAHKLMMVMDETGGIFAEDGEAKKYTRWVRELGMSFLVGQQGMDDLATDFVNNCGAVFAMKQTTGANLQRLADRAASATLEQLQVLNTARPGTGILISDNTPNGPVQFRMPHNARSTDKPVVVEGAEQLVNQGYDIKLYTPKIIAEAQRQLRDTLMGNDIRAWATAVVQAVVNEEPLPDVTPTLQQALYMKTPGQAADIRDKMITDAITQAAYGIPEMQFAAAYDRLVPYMRDDMLAQASLTYPVDRAVFRPEFALNTARYNRALIELKEVTMGDRIETTPELEASLGQQLGGLSAQEQLEALYVMERTTYQQLVETAFQWVEAVVTGGPQQDNQGTVTQLYKRLTVGADEAGVQAIVASAAGAVLQSFAAAAHPEDPRAAAVEATANEFIDHIFSVAASADDLPYGFPKLRKVLEERRDAAEAHPGIDLSHLQQYYPEAILPSPEVVTEQNGTLITTARTAKEQIAIIENELLPAFMLTTNYAPTEADVFFAPDGMDTIIGQMMKTNREQGRVYDALRAKLNGGQNPNLSIVDMIAYDDPLRAQWEQLITERFMYGGMGFTLHRQMIHRMRHGYGRHISNMRFIADERRQYVQARIQQIQQQAEAGANRNAAAIGAVAVAPQPGGVQ
ncbi:MAG TPA: DUF87 domain-containing protein [Candidatus Saccharimonadales bacterium]|nr:DUF87 domain-containing protein [Candidatus Saccharimonadales bacterium]